MLPFDPAILRVIDLEQPRRVGDPVTPGNILGAEAIAPSSLAAC